MKSTPYILLLFTALSAGIVDAQISFEAKIDKEKVDINESIRVDFEMNKDSNHFTPPEFNDFEITSGPSKHITNSWINGERTYKKVITYHIKPKKRGDLVINEARLNINDEIYLTKPLFIKVKSGNKIKNVSNNNTYDDKVHLEVDVSNTKLSVGSKTEITYKLYVSHDVGISGWEVVEEPDYKGFNVSDLGNKKLEVLKGTYKGESYRYVILDQKQLISNEKGSFKLKPLKLNVTLEVPAEKSNVLAKLKMRSLNKTLVSDQITITVK